MRLLKGEITALNALPSQASLRLLVDVQSFKSGSKYCDDVTIIAVAFDKVDGDFQDVRVFVTTGAQPDQRWAIYKGSMHTDTKVVWNWYKEIEYVNSDLKLPPYARFFVNYAHCNIVK